ncbi:MAG: type II secretion system secretin GspD [Burkholderiaceae bacterium]|nr:type II secretion system secretin GspD [Burkholderiaceae bacterium]
MHHLLKTPTTYQLRHKFTAVFIAVSAIFASAPANLYAQKQGEPITLNFVNAEIEAVARTMGVITGRNIVVDPRVKGTINLSSEKPLSPAAAYNQFLATLRLQGVVVVDSQGISKVVPEADAKLQTGVVSVGAVPASVTKSGGNQIVTQIFNLNYDSAANLLPILRPLISPNNTINVNPGNNALIITDYADNLQRIARIIAASDVPNATDVEVLPLKNALASDLAPLILRLVDSGTTAATGVTTATPGQSDTSVKTTVIAEPRSNALIVRTANAARMSLVKSLVLKLDQPSSQSAAGNVHVVFLKNADALKLAITLRASMASTASGSPSAGVPGTGPTPTASPATPQSGATPVQASAQPSTGGQIQADPATNSLIITAAEPQYRQLRAVIDQLDSRRAQVFVESLIAEINSDKAAEFGIQWQNALGSKTDTNNLNAIGTNYGTAGKNLLALTASGFSTTATTAPTVLPATGLNIGLGTIIAGKTILGMFANFLQTTGEGNILSTPNLLTLDNEEAKIIIGQNVPFVTGQYTNSASSSSTTGTVNPFQTVERKDVGLTLKVKPQISENGTIKLEIYQEVSSVQASSINSTTGLITNKRSIQTNVLVEDGGIVVLGGLLQDEYSGNEEKVPLLGDIPLFGNLFKTESRSRKKTNLMVFLRPVVVRDGAATEKLSLDRYDLMRSGQQAAQPPFNIVLPINESAMLPTKNPPAPRPASPDPVQDQQAP